ncbi:MAG: hypothetical protein AAGF20_03535 [Pseudomonadota bacterium]
MLFLLNDQIIEIANPELHLNRRWRAMGCGNPLTLRVQAALAFVTEAVQTQRVAGEPVASDLAQDLAALIITKTGANSLILKPTASGSLEPRLRDLPPIVLETYQRGAANDGELSIRLQA